MKPTEFVRLKFPWLMDLLDEKVGSCPEELMAYLEKGALVEAMEAQAAVGRPGYRAVSINYWEDGAGIRGYVSDGCGAIRRGEDAIFALFTDGTDFVSKALGSEAVR